MIKKILYVILAIAFLMGTHLIAHEHNINLGPSARPSVSVAAGENEATATASLDPLREMELSIEDSPISFTGSGFAYARVLYYFSEDDDGAIFESPDPNDWGTIAVTLVATAKPNASLTFSHQESHNQDTDVDGEVDVGVKGLKKIPLGTSVDVDIEVDQEEGSESETEIQVEAGVEKEVKPYHDNQEAKVEGNQNHFKFCGAKAAFDGEPIASDCDTYNPSFFEFMTFW